VGQKTGSVKRGRRGAETSDVSRIPANTTGQSSRFSWNRMMAYGLLEKEGSRIKIWVWLGKMKGAAWLGG